LPSSQDIYQIIPRHFILFKTRNIVSGDFYFIRQIGNRTIIVAADCTGHGVPGAFMSMLGITILNELVQRQDIINSSLLLVEMRNIVKASLQQTGQKGEQQDGMDIAMCIINKENKELSFSGAYNPCWIFRSKLILSNPESQSEPGSKYELIELPADPMPVGIFVKEKSFIEHNIQLQEGDFIYLFSDGYYSQFGGGKNEKYKAGRLKTYLSTIYEKQMEEQKELLEKELNSWKNENEQTDDVLVMGIKILNLGNENSY
jgi:serine phosphatase RsbU (regulator of sigma subunit)